LPAHWGQLICIDADEALIATQSQENMQLEMEAEQLAYVNYTSGSSGRPKGVMVTHRAITRLLCSQDYVQLDERQTLLHASSISFDAATFEVWGALLHGGCCVLYGERVPTADGLEQVIQQEGVSVMWLTASLFNSVVDERVEALRGVKQLLVGGEALSARHVRRAVESLGGTAIVNGYGPTEGTTFTCCHRVEREEVGAEWSIIPIGRAISNTEVYVLGEEMEALPIGVSGELYIGGAGLARGYLGQSDLTAERFIPHPYSREGGARLYRTGDVVRQRSDGRIEYEGRVDGQVKVRGYRIELGEIELVLSGHARVKECAVVAREDEPGEKRLVAYIVSDETVSASEGQLLRDSGELRQYLQERLPEYMIPSSFVMMEEMPLTANGKLDRRALPAPDGHQLSAGGTYMKARTPVEEIVAAIWAEVLHIERVGVEDNFFELGGHSLLATQVISRIREACQVELPLRTLFESPTVTDLATSIEQAWRADEQSSVPPMIAVSREQMLPLSFAQQRLWFINQLEPESSLYNIPAAVRLSGALDVEALERTLSEVVRRHEALRTTFDEFNGEPVQNIHVAEEIKPAQIDLTELDESSRELEVRRLVSKEASRPFNLSVGPLLRVTLLKLDEMEHVVLLTMHHIVSDGWSMSILIREVAALYEAYIEGGESPLAEMEIQYGDFAVWQREWLSGEVLEEQLGYWREQLADAPAVLELPTDYPRPAVQSHHGASEHFILSPALSERLMAMSRREGATMFMLLLAAWQVLLYRYTGQEDIVVGSPIANRNRKETEGLIGFFVNTLVLRTDLTSRPSFREVLRRVREVCLQGYAHQDVPFEKLVEEMRVERDLSHAPLFQVVFSMLNTPSQEMELKGLSLSPVEGGKNTTAKFDLMLYMLEEGGRLGGGLEYNADLFDAETIHRLLKHFEVLLESVVEQPTTHINRLPMMSEDEKAQVIERWNQTKREYPSEMAVHQLFEQQVERAPEAVAVIDGDTHLTYRELNERANQLAHHLRSLGLTSDLLVALCLPRSSELIISLLAILKAGAAYLPLDPDYPLSRLALMLEESHAPVLITQESLVDELPAHWGQLICIDADEALIATQSQENMQLEMEAEQLAYVNYTSGSSGRPKGVMVTHRAITRLLCSQDYVQLDERQTLLHASSISFDAATFEVWGALLHGGCCVLYGERVPTADGLEEMIQQEGVSVMWLTASLFNSVMDERVEALRGVKQLLVGGEALSARHVRRAMESLAGTEVINGYGPTEGTTFTCCHRVEREEVGAEWSIIPIGRAINNTEVYVLGEEMEALPIGVSGELYIGGAGLARGYLEQADLTAERFVPDAVSGHSGGRLYRTGDLVRRRIDGNLEFIGRVDEQVKVRGYRIELGEIELVLSEQASIRECAVVAREQEDGEKRLVAYIVAAEEQAASSSSEIRAYLAERLPEYMIPSAFVPLSEMPLTANGKLDRRALPAPDGHQLSAGGAYMKARTPVEEIVAAIWAEVLHIERVGMEDNFFELGGHSLLATQVISRIREACQVELPLRTLFESPRVSDLAASIEQAWRAGEQSSVPPITTVSREGAIPLSFAQQRLWFIDQFEPDTNLYNIPAAVRLSGALDVEALERTLSEVVRRHEALRTTFDEVESQPVQVIHEAQEMTLPLIDLTGLEARAREEQVRHMAAAEAARPFNLSVGPLLRVTLLKLDEMEHVVLLTMHHIVSDGWSMSILISEVAALYEAYMQGGESPLAEMEVQYGDFAVWQREWLSGEVLEEQLGYWREQLGDAPAVLELPTDYPRPAVQSHHGASESLALSMELSEQLRGMSRREGATLFMLLLAAWQVLLYRYTGQEDIVVGSPIANRNRKETEGLIGFFVNTLVLRTDLTGRPSFREVLRRVREVCLQGYAHQDVPFEKLVEEMRVERDLSHAPLFQVVFSMLNTPSQEMELKGLSLSPVDGGEDTIAKFDLMLYMHERGGQIYGSIGYNTDLFEGETIMRMAGHLANLLTGIAAQPERAIDSVSLLSAGEEQQLLVEWNDTFYDYPRHSSIQQLFEAQAGRTPDSLALSYEDKRLTYSELNARANQLAHYLRSLGVESEDKIGLCLERSPEMVIAMLGILKAGGAYLPLDPQYPTERLAFMIEDASMRVLLTQDSLLGHLPPHEAKVLRMDSDRALFSAHSEENPQCLTRAEQLAYVIYTSGSTGQPKGVCVTHRAVIRLVCDTNYVQLNERDRIAQVSNSSFDAATFEVWGALLLGGQLVGISKEVALSPTEFAAQLEQQGVTTMFLTTALFNQMSRSVPEAFRSMRYLLVGGDAVDPRWAREVLKRGAPGHLLNGYGPTENTTFSVCYEIKEVAEGATNIPIGMPINQTQCYVLDARQRLVPIGVVGELYLGGDGLARDYLKRPGLTAERFVPHPFSEKAGERLYRTGDLVRRRMDGNLEFIGRMDEQVKLRGFRIELGEIEAVLNKHPSIKECAVVAREQDDGDKRLIAYLVSTDEQEAGSSEIRAYLAERLPDYMIPSAFVRLEQMPLTANGKLDRRALPAPEDGRLETGGGYIAPRTPLEEVLTNIWAEVLRVEGVSVEANFFELGGHSLLATQVISRIREACQVELPLRTLFESPRVSELAVSIEQAWRAGEQVSVPPITTVSREAAIPLSFAQQRLWFIDQFEPQSSLYNIPAAVRLSGALDVEALERTLSEVVRRHEALRTTFDELNGEPAQIIHDAEAITLPLLDLSHLPQDEREAQVRRMASEEAARPFNLSVGPLLRVTLLKLDEMEHVVLLTMHHIVSDGWSMSILISEVAALYEAYMQGGESPLAEMEMQYGDFAVWQREWLSGEVLEEQLSYWRGQLGDAPAVLELPTDYPRPAVQSHRGGYESFSLSETTSAGLKALSRREGVTMFMLLLAAWQVLLYRYTGQEDIVVGSPIANRNRKETEGLIGFFVNTLVLRGRLSGEMSFRELVRQVREVCLQGYAHQDVPFEKLVEEMRVERDLSHAPLFQVMFSMLNTPRAESELPGLKMSAIGSEAQTAKFDLGMTLVESGGVLEGVLDYKTDLFERATMSRLVEHFQTLLSAIVSDAGLEISALRMFGEAELNQALVEWNSTGVEYAEASGCLHELFERQAARTPESQAVVFEDTHLSYRELNERANQLAHHLRALGVGAESVVGIHMERSIELVVSILGTLKAGGAYLPLDPAYPQERLSFMLGDAGAKVLLTHSSLLDSLNDVETPQLLCLDLERERLDALPAENFIDESGAGQVAYVIYTSGSTGEPKGVMIEHYAIVNHMLWMQDRFPLGEADRVLQKTPCSFDASVWEFYAPLLAGAQLVLAQPGAQQDARRLIEAIKRQEISVLQVVPSMLRMLPEDEEFEECQSLRRVFCGGEALTPELRDEFYRRMKSAELCNLYGPTEASIDACYWKCERESGERSVPIGRPIANLRCYLLNERQEIAPLGAAGELYIGGAGLARGYINRAALTSERFIPDPFSNEAGARLYRTGDLARYMAGGQLEFLGRVDHQVKLRGYRIELGEIETVLNEHASIKECAVLVREDVPGDKRLVAYLVADKEQTPSASDLRHHLKERLPEYMIPTGYVLLEEMPLTANGKLDRRALPAPDGHQLSGTEIYLKARTPVEELVAAIWAEVLHAEQVGIHDNFFELGGHSLLATQVISRIREACQVELPLRTLFESPTVSELAASIEQAWRAGEQASIPPITTVSREGAIPLSFAQQRLWFIDQFEPQSSLYNIPAAVRLSGALDVEALERTLSEVVRRHEALRTTFDEFNGEPVQVIHDAEAVILPLLDLSHLPQDEREAQVRRMASEEASHPFNLSVGPLLRVTLVRLAEEEHVVLLTMHHIVSDGWSMSILIREVAALYEAYIEGGESPLAEMEIQYGDFAVWQREWLSGEVLEEQLSYWREQLADAPAVLELPTDYPRPAVQSHHGASESLALSIELSEQLRGMSRREGATMFMLLLAAWQVLLYRYTGQEDIVVGSPIANRNRKETEGLIGFFVNTLVLRGRLSGEMSFRELVRQVREVCLQGYAHQDVPFEKLVEELQPERDLSHAPLFQVMFSLLNTPAQELNLSELRLEAVEVEGATAKFDLMLAVADDGRQQLSCTVNYNAELFEKETIKRMLGHLAEVLREIACEPELLVQEINLLSEAERRRLLLEWNQTDVTYPAQGGCIHELFEAQVKVGAGAVAVVQEDERLSYGQLNERANQLAHHLRACGVGPEVLVGIMMERSVEMLVGVLSILKAGGAYLPLDPAYPQERLSFMLEDAGAGIVITQEHLIEKLPERGARLVRPERDRKAIEFESRENLERIAGADNLAYVIYTSGSTGKPKGVAIEHHSTVTMLRWAQGLFAPEHLAGVLASTSICFDLSVFELFLPLSVGGKIVLCENALQLPALKSGGEVTLINTVPSAMTELVRAEGVPDSVRVVNIAGEPLKNILVQQVYERTSAERVFNLYGPSEDTTYSTWAMLERGSSATPPIGRPVSNTQVYLLDANLGPVPVGVAGELHLGGEGLARCYLNRPQATAEKFIPNPFGAEAGARLYKTGDLARYLPDGQIEYLGRMDQQVKVRGYRIELGEIEAVLAGHPSVKECVVVVHEDESMDKRLLAYVVTKPDAEALTGEWRAFMQQKLPDYMVPQIFLQLPLMPLTPSGKIDRRALPTPEHLRPELIESYVAPRTPVEETLSHLWSDVLGVTNVGVFDDFFALGGHSLLAARMMGRVRETFGVQVPLRNIFMKPTIAHLGESVEEALQASHTLTMPPAEQPARDASLDQPPNSSPTELH
jgi:amino acid adenylation domain-containing protein